MRRIVVLAALVVAGCVSEEQKAARAAQALIEEAKAAAANALREPPSAIFTDVEARGNQVCGLVNGRNGFGGYGDQTRFVYSAGEVSLDPSSRTDRVIEVERCDFDTSYRRCRGETGLQSVLDRCLIGTRYAEPGVAITQEVAEASCRLALERRFRDDVRDAELRTVSVRSKGLSDRWLVTLSWEAKGDDFSGLQGTGRCTVDQAGMTLVAALMNP